MQPNGPVTLLVMILPLLGNAELAGHDSAKNRRGEITPALVDHPRRETPRAGMAAAIWNSTFAICPGDESFSFSFTCRGEGCDLLYDFPTTTCVMNGDTLSCSDGVECKGTPDIVSTAEWIISDENVSFREHTTSEDCEISMSPADASSPVVVDKDTCGVLADGNTGGQTDSSTPTGQNITDSTGTSTAGPSQPATISSARQLRVSPVPVFLIAFIVFTDLVSGTLAIDQSTTLARGELVSIPRPEKRAVAAEIDWAKPLKLKTPST